MLLYRVMVQTEPNGGTLLDATHDFELAKSEAFHLQSQYPTYKITIDAENWPTLNKVKYHYYQITKQADGFGTEFRQKTGHKHSGIKKVWPHA